MTIETDIFAALTGLVAGRVFPDIAPLKTALPFITFQQVGGRTLQPLDNSLPDKKNGRFQLDVWADTRMAAAALALQVEAALVGSVVFTARAVGAHANRHEPDEQLYGTTQDFSVWSDR
mgnify:FL=1